jgi:two-component system response regulator AtoC
MRRRILVVDDEPSIRKVLSATLTREGHDVHCAADGAEAMRRLSEEPFHLVVSDLKMPEVGGMELLPGCAPACPACP